MKITNSLSLLPVLSAILLLIGSSERSNAQDLYVGSNSSGNTTNFISGTNGYSNSYVGHNAGDSNNQLTVANLHTLLTNTGDLYIGYGGNSNLMVISNGAKVAGNTGWIGYSNTASNNTVLVTGSNSKWVNSSDIYMGYHGESNSLLISNGGSVTGGSGYLGYYGNGNTLTVTGTNSLYSNSSSFNLGYYYGTNNSLMISNGANVVVYETYLGDESYINANNRVLVTGTNSMFGNTDGFYLGYYEDGDSITVSNGAKLYGYDDYIGYGDGLGGGGGNSNTLTVTGAHSLYSNSSDLTLGDYGAGNILLVSNGASVSLGGSLYIGSGGRSVAGSNTVIVTGFASSLSVSNNVYVGYGESGDELTLSDGAKATVGGNTYLGYSQGSNAVMLVTGSGSLWTNAGTLTIGDAGSGYLTVADGATVIASGGIVIASNSGSIGTLDIGSTNGGGLFGSEDAQVSLIAPTITFGAGTGTINFNQSDYSYSTNTHTLEYHPFILSSDISGNGSLNQLQSFGTTILTGSNSYTGVTRILDGSIEFSGTQSLYGGNTNEWTAANLIVSNDATAIFTVGGTNPFTEANINQLLGNASSTNGFLDGARLGIDTTGTNFTYGSNLTDLNGGSNALSLVVLGTGTLNLTGSNNYSGYSLFYGGTTVVSGSINPATNNGSLNSLIDVGLLNYSGALVVTNGGSVNASNSLVLIGAFSSVSNSVTVTGTNGPNSSILTAGELFVGSAIFTSFVNLQDSNFALSPSSGNSLVVSNGGVVLGDNGGGNTNLCLVGFLSPSNSVTVTGSNSGVGFDLVAIGAGGSANTMVISNGATVQDVAGVIGGLANVLPFGQNANSNSVIVTGAGSGWENGVALAIGGTGLLSSVLTGDTNIYNGSSYNSLTISNGGTVSSATGYVGGLNCSNNTATITGTGSVWSNSDTLYVGWKGSSDNSLVVSDGGKLISASAFIGYTNSSNSVSEGNSVLVTGSGSLWTNSGNITIGANGGAGNSLTITNGGHVQAERIIVDSGALTTAVTNAIGSSSVTLGGGTNSATLSLARNLSITSMVWSSNGVIAMTPGANQLTISGAFTNLGGTNDVFNFHGYSQGGTNTLITFAQQTGFTINDFRVLGGADWAFELTSNSLLGWYIGGGGGGNVTNSGVQTISVNTTNSSLTIQSGVTTITTGATNTSSNFVTVNNGVLVNNGGIVTPYLTVSSGGGFTGVGTLSGNLTNNGTLTPGNAGSSSGTLTVNGNFTQSAGGVFLLQASSGNQYNKLLVNGTVNLGGTLVVSALNGYLPQFGDKYTFLTSTGAISGTFSSIEAPAGERGRLVIEGDPTASVIIAPQSYTQLAQGRNQLNVATALNSFIPATSGDQLVVSTTLDSLTASQYNQAFNAIMPTFYQQVATIAFNQANAQNMELNQRLWGVRVAEGGGFSMSGLADNYAMLQEGIGDGSKSVLDSKKDILRPGLDNHWGMFVDGNGIFAQANSANMLPGYNSESGGVTTGLTYKWNKNVASGIYAGYQGTYTKSGSNGSGLGTGSSLIDNAVRFGVFGTYGQENGKGFYANALAGGAYHNLQATRVIQYTGVNRTANSSPGAGELDSMLATGYDIHKGKFTYGPTASLQYTYLGANGVNETGAQSLNFNSSGWNSSSMLSSVGAHAAYNWQAGKNVLVVPQISLNWQHEFMQNPYAINGNLGGTSPSFSNWSTAPIRDFLYTGVGFTVEFAKNWNTSFFYNASAGNSDLVSQNIFWSAGLKF